MLREQASQSNRRTAYPQGACTSGGMPAMHVRKQQVPSMTHLFIHHARCVLATGALRLTEYVDNALHHPEEDVVRRGRDEQTHHPCTEPRLQGPSCREGKIMRLLAPTCRPKVLPRVAGAWPSASPSPPCPASASAQPCPACSQMRGCVDRVADTTRTGAYPFTAGSTLDLFKASAVP